MDEENRTGDISPSESAENNEIDTNFNSDFPEESSDIPKSSTENGTDSIIENYDNDPGMFNPDARQNNISYIENLKQAAERAEAERIRAQKEYEAAKRAARSQNKIRSKGADAAARRSGASVGACICISLVTMVLTIAIVLSLLFFWKLPVSGDSFIGSLIERYIPSDNTNVSTPPSTVVGGTEVPGGSQVSINIEGNKDINASAVYAKCSQSVVGIRVVSSSTGSPWMQGNYTTVGEGSGVIYSSDGYIITNHHVISDAISASGGTASGFEIRVYLDKTLTTYSVADIIGSDSTTDLAVIKISAKNLTPVEFADSSAVQVGDDVFAIGSPGGLEFMNSLSDGIVSGVNRNISTDDGLAYDLIQTNTAINPGNSGGALLNTKGELIGICFLKIVAEGYEGMGFAISSNTARDIVKTLIEDGKVSRPMLGVTVNTNYTAAAAKEAGLPAGAWVYEVTKGSAADKAGIKANMIITEFNGTSISDYYGLRTELLKCKPGDTIKLKIYAYNSADKAGEYIDINVTLDESTSN